MGITARPSQIVAVLNESSTASPMRQSTSMKMVAAFSEICPLGSGRVCVRATCASMSLSRMSL